MHYRTKMQFETQTWSVFEHVLKTEFADVIGFDPAAADPDLSTRELQALSNIGTGYQQHPKFDALVMAVAAGGFGQPIGEPSPAVLALCRDIAVSVLSHLPKV